MTETDCRTYLARKVARGEILSRTSEIISAYVGERSALQSLKPRSETTISQYLALFAQKMGKCPDEWTTASVLATVGVLRKEGAQNTVKSYLSWVIPFCRWLVESGINNALNLEKIEQIKIPPPNFNTKSPDQMLTPETVDRVIRAANNSRDRAMIAIAYEGGIRPCGLREMTWGQIDFQPWGAAIRSAEKTGIERYIPIITYRQYLAAWKSDYDARVPGGATCDAPVFVPIRRNVQPKPLSSPAIYDAIKHTARRAGVTDFCPYILRHSHITNQLLEGVPTPVIQLVHWGSTRTNMLSTYTHVSEGQVRDALLQQQGVEIPDSRPAQPLRATQCPRCHYTNAPGVKFCAECGLPLNDEAEARMAQIRSWVTPNAVRDAADKAIDRRREETLSPHTS